ncbi:alpha-galactosidase [Bacteroidales bacterium]|nr:alpha-galactosidase [Bacteroidales bacterium]
MALCSKGQNIERTQQGWNIKTNASVYQLALTENGRLVPSFYGDKAQSSQFREQDRIRQNGPFALEEIPVRGRYADKIPTLELIFGDNTRDCELQYIGSQILNQAGREVLEIIQKDKFYPLSVTSYIRVLPEYDILEKWIVLKNTSTNKKDIILVENLQSGSIYLPSDRYYLTHHSGQWLREFQLQKTELTAGIKRLQSRDFFSFQNTPWFAISTKEGLADDKSDSPVWFGQVHYSGNWSIDLESTHSNHLQIVGGINFWDTELSLKAGESFSSPKFSVGYTSKGTDAAAQLTHDYIRNEILPEKTKEQIRPVLYNSWYATTFDVEETHQMALAKKAKELGVELFVVDDGWFKGRKTDHAGLGDWEVDKEKFPNGLNPLIKQVNELGLDFGIWVEPEMINPNSDLYRKHPDWVLHFPNREKTEWRYQLTLNLAREDVYKYLLTSMRNLLKDHNIKFIKWDRNRGLSQPGWPSAPLAMQREMRLRYMDNLYKMIDELKTEFPHVLFETCSSGGGRPDLGMLERMDQTWASDNTDPIDRLFIQYGYLSAYPANTMVCWTNKSDAHKVNFDEEFIFDVAMQGVLGIGQDITKWGETQTQTAQDKIAEYKQIRDLIQKGKVCRLKSPFEGSKVALQYTSKQADRSIVMCYNLGETTEGSTNESRQSKYIKLNNLVPTANYKIEEKIYTGDYLMNIGLLWPLRGAYTSKIIKLQKI